MQDRVGCFSAINDSVAPVVDEVRRQVAHAHGGREAVVGQNQCVAWLQNAILAIYPLLHM